MKRRRSRAYRFRAAAYERERYWNDPEVRLRRVNNARKQKGLPLRQDVSEIATVGPYLREYLA